MHIHFLNFEKKKTMIWLKILLKEQEFYFRTEGREKATSN